MALLPWTACTRANQLKRCNSRKRRRIIGVAGSCPIADQVASLLDSQLLTMQLLRVELLLNGWLVLVRALLTDLTALAKQPGSYSNLHMGFPITMIRRPVFGSWVSEISIGRSHPFQPSPGAVGCKPAYKLQTPCGIVD